jgi:hypothetical protein
MEVSVLIAVISSGVALVSTIAQGIVQLRQNSRLERLKAELSFANAFSLESLKTFLSLQIQGKTQLVDAVGTLLATSQAIKDKLSLVERYPDSFPDRDLLKNDLQALQTRALEAFGACQMSVDDNEWREAHRLKNKCIESLQLIIAEQRDQPPDSVAIHNQIAQMSELQDSLRRMAKNTVAEISDAISDAAKHGSRS